MGRFGPLLPQRGLVALLGDGARCRRGGRARPPVSRPPRSTIKLVAALAHGSRSAACSCALLGDGAHVVEEGARGRPGRAREGGTRGCGPLCAHGVSTARPRRAARPTARMSARRARAAGGVAPARAVPASIAAIGPQKLRESAFLPEASLASESIGDAGRSRWARTLNRAALSGPIAHAASRGTLRADSQTARGRQVRSRAKCSPTMSGKQRRRAIACVEFRPSRRKEQDGGRCPSLTQTETAGFRSPRSARRRRSWPAPRRRSSLALQPTGSQNRARARSMTSSRRRPAVELMYVASGDDRIGR